MAFNLPNGRADSVCVSMPVIIRCAFGVLVVDTERILSIGVWFLDNPAMPGATGLEFVEVILLPDEFEIG